MAERCYSSVRQQIRKQEKTLLIEIYLYCREEIQPIFGKNKMTKNRDGTSWNEIFEELPEERKAKIRANSARMRDEHSAILKFRDLKEVMRSQIESSKQLSLTEIREIEKNADLILSFFCDTVNKNGGQIKIVLEMPNEVEYDLLKLRDLYEEFEGSPLGPYYEEEDINEAKEQEKLHKNELSKQLFVDDTDSLEGKPVEPCYETA